MVVCGLLVASCSGAAARTPPGIDVTPSRGAASTLNPTFTPSASASLCVEPLPSTSFFCATKNSEGGHGGPPLIDLPSSIAFDDRVSGACVFSLGLATETTVVGLPTFTVTASGPEISGTWRVSIRPGRYYPVIGEASSCVYSVNVRDDR